MSDYRYLAAQIKKDLQSKMVFLAGPRQVGKTTLARSLIKKGSDGYLNWDISSHREKILQHEWPQGKLWVFDEIHKYRQWRNYLKGVYDEFKGVKQILVTGSARLDYYRRGGDSLQGRYHMLRLHPLSVAELKVKSEKDFRKLMLLGGFPEPFFSGSETQAKRWRRDYRTRLIREEIASLEQITDIGSLERLYLRLPSLVGSPLSMNALREDLQVSFKTVKNWIAIYERLYGIFLLPPFGSNVLRAVKKEQKHYHLDWSLIPDEGVRFENLVACHLLKWVHYRQDVLGEDVELRYFRDIDKREVDFIVTEEGKAVLAIECKLSDTHVHPALRYFKLRHASCRAIQLVAFTDRHFVTKDHIEIMPALSFLRDLV